MTIQKLAKWGSWAAICLILSPAKGTSVAYAILLGGLVLLTFISLAIIGIVLNWVRKVIK